MIMPGQMIGSFERRKAAYQAFVEKTSGSPDGLAWDRRRLSKVSVGGCSGVGPVCD